VNGLHGTLHRPETHRAERHIFEGRALKRHILQCRLVKRDADKGLPIKSLSAQVGIVEVHAEIRLSVATFLVYSPVLIPRD
jgi:hypothetical protein